MSKIANEVYEMLKYLFPLDNVKKEHYVNYKGNRLFFDFYIRPQRLLIEVQGQQHATFVKHFHTDKNAFDAQKKRDNLKIEYVQENPELSFVKFYHEEKITEDLVKNKVYDAIKEGTYD